MATAPLNVRKILSGRLLEMAFSSFDKATLAVVVSAWSVASLILLFLLYTLHLSVQAQRDVAAAEAMQPTLPRIVKSQASGDDLQTLLTRLQRDFPEIKFSLSRGGALMVSTSDGAKFRLWLTVLSYIDTISPEYRWRFEEFCVGLKCGTGSSADPMRAILVPEKIAFSLAAEKTKKKGKKGR